MTHYETLINDFLAADASVNNGQAACLWPQILAMCYPALACKPLVHMMLALVFRGLRNQATQCSGHALDFVEVFCGEGWLTFEMLSAGWKGCGFDYVHSTSHDLHTSQGVRLILDSVCCIRKFGLCWLATPCSSFTVMCRHQSARLPENGYLGPEDPYQFVKDGNALMECSALVYFVCYLLSIHVTLEQPTTSVMSLCASLKGVLFFTNAVRYKVYMGAYNGPTVKPLELWSTWPCIGGLETGRPDMPEAESLVCRSRSGFTGRKDLLQQSQIYTQEFGRAVAEICTREWA